MAESSSAEFQGLLDRPRQGDREARRLLLERACGPQAEIARVLELHPRKVSYLWVAATEKLGEGLGTAF
jgi:hypothetical protein